jgi:hypothetical protein
MIVLFASRLILGWDMVVSWMVGLNSLFSRKSL